MRVCKGKAIAFFVLSLVFLPLSAFAQGVLPPHIASQIDDAVREVHGLIQREDLLDTLDDLRGSHGRTSRGTEADSLRTINPPLTM